MEVQQMAETKLFKAEERMERSAAARMLRELADRVEWGRVVLRTAGNELVMEPPQEVVFGFEGEREESSSCAPQLQREVEVSWVEGDTGGELPSDGTLELG